MQAPQQPGSGHGQLVPVNGEGLQTETIWRLTSSISERSHAGCVCVVPPELIHAFRAAKRLTDRHSPTLEQAALANFLPSGACERHVRKLRRKNDAAPLSLASLNIFGDAIEVQGLRGRAPCGGSLVQETQCDAGRRNRTKRPTQWRRHLSCFRSMREWARRRENGESGLFSDMLT